MTSTRTRRQFMTASAGLAAALSVARLIDPARALTGLAGADLGAPVEFSFGDLQARAAKLAAQPFVAPLVPSPEILEQIDYDHYQAIRYRREKSLRFAPDGRNPCQFFHLGNYAREPVRMHVIENDRSREILYSAALFDMPSDHPARRLEGGAGFAGFRVMAADLKTDWFAAMGASYFRTSGPYNQYGLSARGVAIDTAMPHPEEFPRFSNYWLEGGSGAAPFTIYALLEGPSLTGAYKMITSRSTNARDIHRIDMEIEAALFARKDVARLGIAPFSSMFWYGETNRRRSADWRPEIHDSDGLAILTGSGEHIWRPINNPPRVNTSTFIDKDVKGFGLLQRDRDFVHYLDDGVFYERRPSVWVEPLEKWGDGAVHLVEIPTADETFDNIVAYWAPAEPFKAGEQRRYRYRLSWLDEIAVPHTMARAIGTWTGMGGRPGHKRPEGVRKFVIDFQGGVFEGLGREDGVEFAVSASRGDISNVYNHPVVDQKNRWRAFFDIKAAEGEPVDLRGYLKKGGQALTETWIYQVFPEALE